MQALDAKNIFTQPMYKIHPNSFDDVAQIAQDLMRYKTIEVCFHEIDTELAYRIFDFLSGMVYMLGGEVHLTSNEYVCFSI